MERGTSREIRFGGLVERSGLTVLERGGSGDPVIADIAYDSRKVVPGTLYIAMPGTSVHGDTFIDDAISKGAAAIISENAHPESEVPWVRTKGVRGVAGTLGKTLWCIDRMPAINVGITGTNGKTTVAHLFESLFGSVFSPEKVWMFGTISYHLGGSRIEATHTTPETLDIFRHIGRAASLPSALVMEVSSHSLALDRIGGLLFDLAVFTNLTQDHLDFHKDMETYYQAKKRLFTDYLKIDGCSIVNIDDACGKRLVSELAGKRCVTYGRAEGADVRLTAWKCDWDGCRIEVSVKSNVMKFTSKLRGFFNVYNMGALIAGAVAKGCDPAAIQAAFDRVPVVNGRMERVAPEMPFAVVVDYAHTPDALDNVLRTAKAITCGRLLCVFGCGGDRDRKKRPLMGAAVAGLCDEAWVTSDNPRTENPQRIIEEIIEGIPLDFPFQVNPDRRLAIAAALREARPGDCIVIAGKGHETYQEICGVKSHFDDKEVVAEIVDGLRKEAGNHGA